MDKIKNFLYKLVIVPYNCVCNILCSIYEFFAWMGEQILEANYKLMLLSLVYFWFFTITVAVVILLLTGIVFVLWNTGIHYALDLPKISYINALSLIGFAWTLAAFGYLIRKFIRH